MSQGPVLSLRPQLLGPGTLPGWELLITKPLGYWTKKVGSLVSGFLASSTLKSKKYAKRGLILGVFPTTTMIIQGMEFQFSTAKIN